MSNLNAVRAVDFGGAEKTKSLAYQGISPYLKLALDKVGSRIDRFSLPVLRDLNDALRDALGKVADKHGFALDQIELLHSEDNAHIHVGLSVIDPLGLDGHARLFLKCAESVGLSADMLGVRYKLPSTSGPPLEIVITGLVQVGSKYLVRFHDIASGGIMHCSAEIAARRFGILAKEAPRKEGQVSIAG
ncbi:MAG: hypothetical protein CVV05_01090 [Gammaproteobacteria bacterium HGW-Gammaproteobacteria-1]|jgi:hypothetical protein|nr:MAG: hypothetical protein CVV05_01090 [Gammaproteobacteria bacterium HGW-Gammaproteobacteria-1]